MHRLTALNCVFVAGGFTLGGGGGGGVRGGGSGSCGGVCINLHVFGGTILARLVFASDVLLFALNVLRAADAFATGDS